MILLDTNVLSELMRPTSAPAVVSWVDSQPQAELWVSAVTVAEIRLGIALLPDGKRRRLLADMAVQMFQEDFLGRCLPFDSASAEIYADIVASRMRHGRPISVEDAQIAAIARSGRLEIATRNSMDFPGIAGLRVINPWTA